MNVQEELLRDKIDPGLTDEALAGICGEALGASVRSSRGSGNSPGLGGPAAGRRNAGYQISGYRVLTGGCWNRVIAVALEPEDAGTPGLPEPETLELVLKISPHEGDPDIIREYKVLTRFAELSDFPVPEPLYLDLPEGDSEGPGGRSAYLPGTALVMTKIPGDVMHQVFGRLSGSDRRQVMDELTEDVIRLHKTKSRGFGGVELPPEDREPSWPAFWLPRLQEVIRMVRDAGVLPERVFTEAEALWPFLESLLDIGDVSTLTHYDIWAGNVMVDSGSATSGGHRGATISGYIDIPGNWADYAWEISFMQVFGLADEEFLGRYEDAQGLDDTFELRLRAYQLRTFMKHAMMYPSEEYYRKGTEMCLGTLRRGKAG